MSKTLLIVDDKTLDRAGRRVMVGERVVNLTPSELDLLALLMAAPGRAPLRGDRVRRGPPFLRRGADLRRPPGVQRVSGLDRGLTLRIDWPAA